MTSCAAYDRHLIGRAVFGTPLRKPEANQWVSEMLGSVRIWLKLTHEQRAVTAVEYGLIAAAIILVFLGALSGFASSLSRTLTTFQAFFPNGG